MLLAKQVSMFAIRNLRRPTLELTVVDEVWHPEIMKCFVDQWRNGARLRNDLYVSGKDWKFIYVSKTVHFNPVLYLSSALLALMRHIRKKMRCKKT